MNQSDDKRFALEVLQIFDELAQPEIKNRVMGKIWGYVLNYIHKIILKKPDEEINASLLTIYKKLHPKFQQVDLSLEIQKQEKFSGVKIPNVGELARQRNLVKLDENKLNELLEEFGV